MILSTDGSAPTFDDRKLLLSDFWFSSEYATDLRLILAGKLRKEFIGNLNLFGCPRDVMDAFFLDDLNVVVHNVEFIDLTRILPHDVVKKDDILQAISCLF